MTSIKRKLSILGSTGSVGTNTLNIVRENRDRFDVVSLSCGSSVDLLMEQIQEFSPQYVSVSEKSGAEDLKNRLGKSKIQIFYGSEGHRELVEAAKPDVLLAAMLGSYGLAATLQGIEQNVSVLGIANKEILVMAGPFILEHLKKSKTQLVPVDSEHSAIFQALRGNRREELKKIILTASGGPFRTWPINKFNEIQRSDALKHPNWVMGAKITVDSATMMNKGLEFIEALRLFQVQPEKVEIVVHPQSIIHSLVEYHDGSVMAQLGLSDMRIPISLALSYPERLPLTLSKPFDLLELRQLSFEAPDMEKFSCLRLAIDAERLGPHGPIVLNAANEVAVDLFLCDKIQFVDIPAVIERALAEFKTREVLDLASSIDLDAKVKAWAYDQINFLKVQEA